MSCNGGTNGTASVSVSGGSPSYTYSWAPSGGTNATASGLAAGTYTCTITDASNCEITKTVTVDQPTALSLTPSSQTNVACNGGATGTASVNAATGGAGGYTYNWTPGNPTGDGTTSVSGLTAGTWTCTVTDLNGCTSSQSFTITQLPALIVNAVVNSNETCNTSNGQATASAAGGTAPYTYEWSNSAVTATITDVPAGTYSVTITDANSCTATASVTIVSNGITASATVDANVSCNGGNNGGATASASGGTPPYTYSWDNGATTASIADVAAGTYTVTITDDNLCSNTASVTITEPTTAFSASTIATNVSCYGDSNGSIDLTVTGGTAPYSFEWDGGETTEDLTGLTAGTYNVTVTDANGCTTTASRIVFQPMELTASTIVDNNVSVNGGSDGAATVNVIGGTSSYTYAWSNSATTASISGVTAGTYNVVITDANNCTTTASVTITQPIPIVVTGNETCENTTAILTATGADGYEWYDVPVAGTSIASGNEYTTPVLSANTTYYVEAVGFGPQNTVETTFASGNNHRGNMFDVIFTSDQVITGFDISPMGSCPIEVYYKAGTYSGFENNPDAWTLLGSTTVTYTGSPITISVGNLSIPAGQTYSIYVTSATTAVSLNYSNGGSTYSDGTLTVSTGVGLEYPFTQGTGAVYNPRTFNGRIHYKTLIPSGTRETVDVIVNPAPSISYIASDVSCNGGSNGTIDLTVTGGTTPYTFAWSNTAITEDMTGLSAGTYDVTVTDDNGCTATASVTVNEPTVLSASISSQTNVACNGGATGSATVTVTGGTGTYTYSWAPAGGNAATASGLAAGTYTVTVTDGNLCTTNTSVTITEPTTALSASTVATNVSCNGVSNGTIDLTVTGGTAPYAFVWSNSATTEDMTGLAAGTYDVTVTDANGCTTTASVTITQPTALSASISSQTNVACNGGTNGSATVTVTGGTAPYTYSWAPTGGNAATASGLAAGTYTVTVTDGNLCNTTKSVTITQPTVLSAYISSQTNIACNGGTTGSATVTVTGGTAPYTYLWSNSASTATTTGLTAGTYTVLITDANLCTTNSSVTITQPTTALSASAIATNVSCNGSSNGTIDLTVTGGTAPYAFVWSNTAITEDMTGLSAGTYNVTVTDANGCTTTASATVTEPNALIASSVTTAVSCNGGSNGTIDLTVTGGTAPYTFVWSNTATTEDMTGLSAGTYDVTVTDANGCTATASVTINEPTVLSASGVATNVSCNGGSNGTIDLTVTGGTAPYGFVWSNTATTEDMTGLSAGTYDVTVTDAKGCTTTASVTVNEPTALSASISSQTNILCNGAATGSATVTANGGTASYEYLWSNGATTATVAGLEAGTYNVTVTDANGCTANTSVTIDEPTSLNLTILTSNVTCNGGSNGSATATVSGGVAPYSYSWSDSGVVGANPTTLTAGTYTLTVTDDNGCTVDQTITIDEPDALTASFNSVNVSCPGSSDGTATVTVTGGTAPYEYLWSNGASTASLVGLTDGTYTVTITDDNGCTLIDSVTVVTTPDVTAPVADVATLPTVTVECNVPAGMITAPTATDNCVGTLTGTTTDPLIYTTQGTYTITWTYNDGNGNSSTQTQTVIVDDITAPVADLATIPTVTVECSVPAGMITAPTATDNCVGTVTATTTDPLTYTAQGTYTITWTYNDGNGNSSTQTQTVIVDDITAPVADVTTLPTVTVECSVPAGMITAPTATDNCVGTITGTTTSPFTYTAQGTYTITWTYNDGNGNITTQTQTVIVDDITAPVANVATLPTVTVECNVPAGMITAPTATDNCAGTVTATTTDPLTYTAQGTYTITWIYNDGNGNTTTQTQTVVVDDTTAPVADVINLPEIVNYCGVMSDEIPVPTATDNCAGVLNATTTDPLDYTEVGTYVITWTYDDGNGNTTSQTQTVTVEESPLNAVTFDDAEFVYNGTVQSINVNNLPVGATVTYTTSPETGSDNGAVNAGIYTVTAVVMPQPEAFNCAPVTLTATITIERAPQTITFDPLSVKNLETDVDFQLDATASSGLEVYYTYTYTSPDPAANVSSTGWVTLLTSGEITITAHQDGNENYLPAQEVEQPLIIESSDASIFTMVVGDVTYDTPQSNIYHLIDCGDNSDSVEVTIVTEVGATVQPGHTFTIQTPQPGIYTATVTVTSEDGISTETYTVTVERRFDFSDIVVQKFDNVLLVNNNPQNNGGYEFTAYEWYRNGQLVGTEQYYSAGNNSGDMLDPDAEYMVKVTTAQGEVLQTCLGQIFLQHINSARLYPNPVAFGQKLTIEADLPAIELENMTIAVYTLNGALVKEVKSSSRITEIDAPMEEAVYIVMLKSANYSKTFKVIVR
ncbi:Adhesin AidA-related protein [Flavobacterium beibuense]|uniref:Adhesin AidA-related protein n=1 Tax=Flavobacterium beibuense TaxID=657326 RepID=A0A444WB03_9FLAO|nr:Adhesin AidA-related protein [Flavobacterium beibuense]